jgi:hypothetical protein
MRPGVAPDGVPEDVATATDPNDPNRKIGGTLIGGDLTDEIRGLFKPTPAGWWIAMGNIRPDTLSRARGIGGRIIQGVDSSHEWCVPTLLHLGPEKDGRRTLTSAIPAIYRDYQWQTPKEFNEIIDRLGAWLRSSGEPDREDAMALAVDILAVNYHISIHEISAAGWFSEDLILRIISAAVDFSE